MAKQKTDYFELVAQQVGFCVKASELLSGIIGSYNADSIPAQRSAIHTIEHSADELQHTILTRLSTEFITPIDQEDILRLVQIIDDVTDALDEVVLECYMFHLSSLPQGAAALAGIVNRCVHALYDAVCELKNFKKPEKLHDLLVTVNSIENEADAVYVETIHTLFADEGDSKKLFGCKSVCDSLENCCDLCEHAADAIELLILRNT